MTKVLIVDDHPDIRTLLAYTLGGEYEVLQARNGVEALQVTRRENPAAILLDIMMPGKLDGMAVLTALKSSERTSRTPIAMVTARGQAEEIVRFKNCGADGYFVKPFSPQAIVSWLHQHC
jgi:DNA-binding response OmpR family regulator